MFSELKDSVKDIPVICLQLNLSTLTWLQNFNKSAAVEKYMRFWLFILPTITHWWHSSASTI